MGFNQYTTRGLIDVGASINLLGRAQLKNFPYKFLLKSPTRIKGVNPGICEYSEWYHVTLTSSNGRSIDIPMLIEEGNSQRIILGLPAL